jgi:hypothetical protein
MRLLLAALTLLFAGLSVGLSAAASAKAEVPPSGGTKVGDLSITGRETWSGMVTVDGVVTVRKGGELTVEPGTRVRFVRRDLDGDGIGDAELRVEGKIFIRGEEDRPVVFTSAEKAPAPADWKFLIIDHGESAEARYAVFEYAFSGVQIHYTRGTFSRIVSRRNVDGFRFSTSPVVLTDSLLTGNEHGVRFEERGAGATIRRTVISGNTVGVFAVVKCRGLTSFADNRIEGNSEYAVKLGEKQSEDLPMGGNWWGADAIGDPQKLFFDGRRERGLGNVVFTPVLASPPAAAGPGLAMTERGNLP